MNEKNKETSHSQNKTASLRNEVKKAKKEAEFEEKRQIMMAVPRFSIPADPLQTSNLNNKNSMDNFSKQINTLKKPFELINGFIFILFHK